MSEPVTNAPGPETIGQRLRRLRLERGLSQRELSERGVSYAYISRIEAGSRQPSVKALRKLARKLGVSPEFLETGSEIRDVDQRELRLATAEIALRLEADASNAEAELRAILEEAQAAGDLRSATRARVGLGLAAATAGRHADAVELLERALEESEVPPYERPDVYFTLGRSYAAFGEPRRAVALFERCLEQVELELPQDVPTQTRFATSLSHALVELGDIGRAHEVVSAALDRAGSTADAYTRIRLLWSLANVERLEGNLTNALDHARRALALLESTEDTLQLGRAHLLCGALMIGRGEAERAGKHLELAERLLGARPDSLDLAYLRTEQAKRLAALGDTAAADKYARESLSILGDSDPGEQGSAWTVIAGAAAVRGDVDAATDGFRRAVELLEGAGKPQDAAQAYRGWARVLREHGREREALDVLDHAAELASAPPLAPLRSQS